MTPAPTKPSEALRADLADEALPLWPDSDGGDPTPHPDGRPWKKACADCAFRIHDPQELGSYYQESLRNPQTEAHFYCVHRFDQSCHRVCACFAAIQRKLRRTGQ